MSRCSGWFPCQPSQAKPPLPGYWTEQHSHNAGCRPSEWKKNNMIWRCYPPSNPKVCPKHHACRSTITKGIPNRTTPSPQSWPSSKEPLGGEKWWCALNRTRRGGGIFARVNVDWFFLVTCSFGSQTKKKNMYLWCAFRFYRWRLHDNCITSWTPTSEVDCKWMDRPPVIGSNETAEMLRWAEGTEAGFSRRRVAAEGTGIVQILCFVFQPCIWGGHYGKINYL